MDGDLAAPQERIDRSKIRLGIVCPMANEGVGAVRFTQLVLEKCVDFAAVTFFAIFDGVSHDESLDMMNQLAQNEPRVTIVWAPENRCVVDAYIRGYREALASGADWILEIDAGFSHRPEDLSLFFREMEKGMDCVFASRFMPGASIRDSSWKRSLLSWGGTRLVNLLLGTHQTDMTSGFQLFSSDALKMVLERGIHSRAHFFQTEIKVYCRKLSFVEVPIHYSMPSSRLGSSAVMDALGRLARLFRLRLQGKL
jgi:dolichol-phosphate mannosyltransferase